MIDKKPCKVLLVDDEQAEYHLFQGLFKQMDDRPYHLDWVSTFDEGVSAVKKNAHDIYFLDYRLEGDRSGLEIFEQIGEIPAFKPVVMFTAFGAPEVDSEAMERGAADFITKDELSKKSLERIIRHALHRNRVNLALRESEDRYRGLAQFTTAIVHNIGNILNGVKLSGTRVQNGLSGSKVKSLGKLSRLLGKHEGDLAEYLSSDPKGKLIPSYISELGETLSDENKLLAEDVSALNHGLLLLEELIKNQQAYAKDEQHLDSIDMGELMDTALKTKAASLRKINVVKDYQTTRKVRAIKNKMLHVLINLVKNAVEAMDDVPKGEQTLTVTTVFGDGRVVMRISDNGCGISPDKLDKIFKFGFTTKKKGHGFGLHFCKKTIQSMGGNFAVESDGEGKGATFVIGM